ncbi:hypothetical protein C2845_PM03G21470 [Panicum miliaceum]|uniref:Protein FAR1-RELATED SEQUENCE n=1 Tax=Panicum miliaceum TaxID=4540 RepID=A0A3L6T433_PANMI|nr:hypothetical protein C2845_PM03G21470 [Panicum miliaceum]
MTRFGVKNIPERYILKRWTQEAVTETEIANSNAHVQANFIARGLPLSNRRSLWFTNLSTAFAGLAAEGCVSRETYTLMDTHIKLMHSALEEIKKRKRPRAQKRRAASQPPGGTNIPIAVAENAAENQNVSAPANDMNSPSNEGFVATSAVFPTLPQASGGGGAPDIPTAGAMSDNVGNPPKSRVKGRKKEKRLKKGMNAEAKRKNKCGICKCTGHNAAKCPEKMVEKGL